MTRTVAPVAERTEPCDLRPPRVVEAPEPIDAPDAAAGTAEPRARRRAGGAPAWYSRGDDGSPDEIEELWREYRERGASEARDRLILHYAPQVKFAAGRIAAGLPRNVEMADILSYGMFGLIDAIERFDPDRGHRFETYLFPRIRGAIFDALRALDWAPRSIRAKNRAIERAEAKLENELKKSPDDQEVAAELGVTARRFAKIRSQIASAAVLALDEPLSAESPSENGATFGDRIVSQTHNPEETVEARETLEELGEAIRRLPPRERQVLVLYYYEGLTLAAIGSTLGVTESRACQLHRKAIDLVRARMSKPAVALERYFAGE